MRYNVEPAFSIQKMMNWRVFIINLIAFFSSSVAFAQTSKTIDLGISLSEIKCKESDKFLIIISHGSMVDGYKCNYDSIDYFVGVNSQHKVVYVSVSDTNFIIGGVKYFKIKFKDLGDEVKANIRYELPFAYYVRINEEWFLGYATKDTFVKRGKGFIKKNALPKFAFKRSDISKKSSGS